MPRKAQATSDLTVLHDEEALARAVAALTRQCRHMRDVHARTGLPPLRDFTADFSGVCRIVTGQQLSASSAAAIWGRFAAAVTPFDAPSILALSDEALRAPGLSSGKIRTIRAVASAVADGTLDFERLNTLPDAAVITELTRLHGIGPWTAEVYLLFALRRADAFPAGDLALQLAAQKLLRLKERPQAARLAEISQTWRPFRGAAARLLWAEYALNQGPGRPAAPAIATKVRKRQ
jgi:DNA-3-methyladenine glycosylase II